MQNNVDFWKSSHAGSFHSLNRFFHIGICIADQGPVFINVECALDNAILLTLLG